jgi:hypothetical protein
MQNSRGVVESENSERGREVVNGMYIVDREGERAERRGKMIHWVVEKIGNWFWKSETSERGWEVINRVGKASKEREGEERGGEVVNRSAKVLREREGEKRGGKEVNREVERWFVVKNEVGKCRG